MIPRSQMNYLKRNQVLDGYLGNIGHSSGNAGDPLKNKNQQRLNNKVCCSLPRIAAAGMRQCHTTFYHWRFGAVAAKSSSGLLLASTSVDWQHTGTAEGNVFGLELTVKLKVVRRRRANHRRLAFFRQPHRYVNAIWTVLNDALNAAATLKTILSNNAMQAVTDTCVAGEY